jgi:Flp pilus assembly protein CpaB
MSNTSRTRNLGLAAGLAVVAALLTLVYASRGGKSGPVDANAAVAVAPVLVATHDLAVGTPVSSALAGGSIVVKKLPAESIAPLAVTNARALRGEVVIQPIYKGEQITSSRFGPSGAQGLRANLHGALRAISISGDPQQLLASTLRAGDHVDVIGGLAVDGPPATRVVLRDLLVLVPATSAEAGATGATTSQSVTLQLTDKQVQTLFWVMKNGTWSLVLRPSSKASVTATSPTYGAAVLAGK